jgi:MFS family permease
VPFLIILAPTWNWIVLANVLLGVNQGLCWSTTVIMKIDLVGPKQRGLAMGLNEFAGYLAVSIAALLSGFLAAAYNLRHTPFYPGIAFAVLGLLFSALFVRETKPYASLEARLHPGIFIASRQNANNNPSFAQVLLITSWKDRALFASSQAGMVNNLNDGMVWGLVPIFLAGAGVPLERIALVAAVYPGVWGISQLFTGALSDWLGRKRMIASGMWVQAFGIGLFVAGKSLLPWLSGSILLGIGTAMVYPTLLAAVSDVAHPEWRASAVGVYRLWRDGGYALGALLSGLLADALGIPFAMLAIAALTFLSGMIVALIMYETHPSRRATIPLDVPAQQS